MMTVVDLTTDALTGLDWSPVLPCEHGQHSGDGVAEWDMSALCPLCDRAVEAVLCTKCKVLVDTAHRLTDRLGCGRVASRWQWLIRFDRF